MNNKNIAIIGLGYVGLPLAVEFGKKYKVLGFDINKERVQELINGEDRTLEANLEEMIVAVNLRKTNPTIGLSFSSNIEDLKAYDIFIVTVPTPIDEFNNPI
jgi:UDP-N-acetyl-D-galactosamine dehydrogenase